MRRAIGVLAALLLVGPAYADSPLLHRQRPPAVPLPMPYRDGFPLVGKVRRTDPRSIVIARERKPDARIHVQPGTHVTLNGLPAHLDELPPGALVRAQFEVVDDRFQARWIEATFDPRVHQRQARSGPHRSIRHRPRH